MADENDNQQSPGQPSQGNPPPSTPPGVPPSQPMDPVQAPSDPAPAAQSSPDSAQPPQPDSAPPSGPAPQSAPQDPPPQHPPPAGSPKPVPHRRMLNKKALIGLGLLVTLILAIVIVAALSGSDEESQAPSQPQASQTPDKQESVPPAGREVHDAASRFYAQSVNENVMPENVTPKIRTFLQTRYQSKPLTLLKVEQREEYTMDFPVTDVAGNKSTVLATFKKSGQRVTLTLVRQDGKWLVDFIKIG